MLPISECLWPQNTWIQALMGLAMIELVIEDAFMIIIIMSNNSFQELKRLIIFYETIRLFKN